MRPLVLLLLATAAAAGPFCIRVTDDATGRGVPLVELKTVAGVRYVTDSGGIVALDDPGLAGGRVFFHVSSHGYEFAADGFGLRGVALDIRPGGRAELKIRRKNIAERLYRITGEGIYRDTVLCGLKPPIAEPLLNAQVCGQDTVMAAPWRGKIFWLWGDTNRPAYPLGNFAVTAATSELPGRGGLDPSVGIDLHYFAGPDGFAKPMCPLPGPGPKWISGLCVVENRLVGGYVRVKTLGEMHERGVVVYSEKAGRFEKLAQFAADEPMCPIGHATNWEGWVLFCNPYPTLRVRATIEDLANPRLYQAFSCLRAGTCYSRAAPPLDRGEDGVLRWGWKTDTSVTGAKELQEMVAARQIRPEESWLPLRDVETSGEVFAHAGSLRWNAWRKRWVLIAQQWGGSSLLGEIFYSEAPTPLGPWLHARKVVTHEKMTFYNPVQHDFFDEDGGRFIYFEGTYTTSFSGNEDATPRYEYNQIMYRLDLSDPRLALPEPVAGCDFCAMDRPAEGLIPVGAPVKFYALPPGSDRPGTVPYPPSGAPMARVWPGVAAWLRQACAR